MHKMHKLLLTLLMLRNMTHGLHVEFEFRGIFPNGTSAEPNPHAVIPINAEIYIAFDLYMVVLLMLHSQAVPL